MVQISPATGPRQASPRSLERQREILGAASRLFRARGLHDVGMRDVAAELGMSAGNLYYYFAGKQDLLAFCQEETLRALLAHARRILRRDISAAGALEAIVAAHVELLNETLPGSLAHLEVEALAEQDRRRILRQRRSYEQLLRRLIADGQKQGAFRPEVDPTIAVFGILGAVNWTVKWFRPGGRLPARIIGEQIAQILIGGLQSE